MKVECQVSIKGSREAIWDVITDIENASETITAIEKIEILEKPDDGFVGLKWRETRTMFGKTATEDMVITEATPNESYKTHAESHGSVYTSTHVISEDGEGHSLTMTFGAQAQSFFMKILALPMGLLFKGMMRKAILKDLQDIKAAVEKQAGA